MSKEIRQLPEVTTPATTDWYVLQKSSNNQTSRISGENLIPPTSVKSPMLGLSAAIDATNGVKSQVNVGAAGGTMYYINLGGIKMLWGRGAALTVGGAGFTLVGFTLPTGFFTTVQSNNVCIDAESPANTGNFMYISSANSTTTLVVTLKSAAATTVTFSIFVIGT